MNSFADLLWLKMPAAVRRVFRTLGVAMGDGAYLRRWAPVAVWLPVGGLALGMLLGIVHPGTVYTYSFTVVALMLGIATLGAGIGFWTWVGFVLADLVATDRSRLPGFGYYATGSDGLFNGWLPLALSYVLLGALLVMGPLLGTGFAARTRVALRKADPELAAFASHTVYIGVVAVYSFGWAQATPFMIRPLWSFAGTVPETIAVQPIQSNTGWFALVAAAAGVARAILTQIATKRPARPSTVKVAPPPTKPVAGGLLSLVGIPVQAGLLTLLLGGLVASVPLGIGVFALICAVFAARVIAIPLIPGYTATVRRIPLLLRMGACIFIAYAMSSAVVQPAVNRGERSFTTLVVVIFVSLGASVFLLPGQPLPMFKRKIQPPGVPGLPAPPGPRAPMPAPPYPAAGTPNPGAGPGPGVHPRTALRPRAALLGVLALVGTLLLWADPAYADNCSGLTDCSFAVKVGLVLAGIVLVGLAIMLLPELLAGAEVIEGIELIEGGEGIYGGMVGSGAGGAELTAEELVAMQELAASTGVEVGETVTAAEIDTVEAHLATVDEFAPNDAMISRIRDAMAEGRPLDVAERNFMQHELTEAKLVSQGVEQDVAHQASMTTHETFANYHADVIQQFSELFNSNWFKYWGI